MLTQLINPAKIFRKLVREKIVLGTRKWPTDICRPFFI